ncbi:MAG: RES family NAD+ phosphorylase [Oscillospiraceae bacterium]|nr:RES family NAD+ phosphorylase [Oscillospiraceae bacterium]
MFNFFKRKTKRNQNKEAMELVVSVFIIAVMLMAHTEISEKWIQFKEKIKKGELPEKDDLIKKSILSALDKSVYTLRSGETVYRSRIIENIKLPDESKNYLETRDGILQLIEAYELNEVVANFIKGLLATEMSKQVGGINKYWMNGFWGFNAKESDAPPKEIATAGRINPCKVPYLYVAENAHTAITEARPIIGQMVSVAKIKISRDLRLFDFCAISPFDNNDTEVEHLLRMIAREFSMPNHKKEDYLPTQYVANLIKNNSFEFDGIRYPSSLHEGGVNIVLFNTNITNEKGECVSKNYCVESTALHVVKSITIEEKQILPIES